MFSFKDLVETLNITLRFQMNIKSRIYSMLPLKFCILERILTLVFQYVFLFLFSNGIF